ncbi:RND family efflux transporter, MFP subunit [Singulisphaera sp. GP187]|uniref:efflux RND transporter periplasmic adaptor subunit n=1 Tax=Singulisphaera sp. GP187 TaxID=1882752 RepID=UPI00092B67B0|nr:efflux RND transporter periplasmic adaptor subunit [Singulisphaera sp. GP187]SIO60515.1 RND family efflux transporter, MFP subunit [Singulisphaera sp. GP187]
MKRILYLSVAGHRNWLVAVGLLSLVVAAGVGHDRRRRVDASPKSKPVPAKVMVDAVRPRRASLHRNIEQPGQIEAFERTALYSKIPGFVERYHFDIGDRVRKGQLLAELSVPEVVEELHQKEAAVIEGEVLIVQAQAMLRVAEAKVTQSDATLRLSEASRLKAEATKSWWKLEHNRVSRLLGRGASSQAEMEQTDEKFKTADAAVSESVAGVALAKAGLVESKAQRDKAAADVRVAEARLRVARADRDRAAAILGYARIEAPYDGVLTRRGVDTGTYVQPPAGNATGAAPLFEIARTDQVRIFVDVPEADAALVKAGGPARVLVQALGDRDFSGRVTRSSWLLEDRTRTLRTEIDLPNTDGILRPGMYATARIPVSRPETLTVPTSSVFLQDDQAWVVRLMGNMAVRTPVRLGLRDRQRVEVLRKQRHSVDQSAPAEWEDFTDTDLVVRDNPSTLVDGQEIAVRPESTSVASLTPDP